MTGSVLFSGLPSQFAEFYDYVRGLEYDESPDYNRWQGIYRDLLDPYTRADEPFDFDSVWDIEDVMMISSTKLIGPSVIATL